MKSINQQAITEMVNQDLECSRQLLALLEQEAAAVQSRNFDILQHLVDQKSLLMKQLKDHAETRSQWLKMLNQPANDSHWLKLIQQYKESGLEDQWLSLKETIEQCQMINEINGKVIQRGIKCHEQLLKLMRGNTSQTDLYNAKGKHQLQTSYGCFAEA